MSVVMVFDTETSGIPPKSAQPCDFEKYNDARLIELAYIIYDNDVKVLEKTMIVKPDFEISNSDIHGITKQFALDNGIPISDVMESFYRDVMPVDVLVGHNVSFDISIMLSESHRLGRSDVIDKINKCEMVCTLEKSRKYFGTTTNTGLTLSNVYMKLFGEAPGVVHRALDDVILCSKCYNKMKEAGDLYISDATMTKQIAQFFSSCFFVVGDYSSDVDGIKPRYCFYSIFNNDVLREIDYYIDNGYSVNDITIMFASIRNNNVVSRIEKKYPTYIVTNVNETLYSALIKDKLVISTHAKHINRKVIIFVGFNDSCVFDRSQFKCERLSLIHIMKKNYHETINPNKIDYCCTVIGKKQDFVIPMNVLKNIVISDIQVKYDITLGDIITDSSYAIVKYYELMVKNKIYDITLDTIKKNDTPDYYNKYFAKKSRSVKLNDIYDKVNYITRLMEKNNKKISPEVFEKSFTVMKKIIRPDAEFDVDILFPLKHTIDCMSGNNFWIFKYDGSINKNDILELVSTAYGVYETCFLKNISKVTTGCMIMTYDGVTDYVKEISDYTYTLSDRTITISEIGDILTVVTEKGVKRIDYNFFMYNFNSGEIVRLRERRPELRRIFKMFFNYCLIKKYLHISLFRTCF